jgi:PII-like signaling protein
VCIFIGESDTVHREPAYMALLELLKARGLAGATVLRGIAGFGAASHIHSSHLLRLSQDLPVVIEVVDSQARLDGVLPEIEPLIGEGLITMEKVRVLRYGSSSKK